jgi:ABC-type sugar transport system substrate-binding protein
MRTTVAVGAALLAATLGLTACGNSAGASHDSASASYSAASTKAAQDMIDKYAAFPTAPDLKPLAKTPSKEHSVVGITCPLPQCGTEADALKDATGDLGWKSKVIVADFAPDAYISAWESALASKPDGILYIATFPNKTIQAQLDQAKAAGIWVIESAPAPDVKTGGDSPIAGAVQPRERVTRMAQIQASLVIADSKSTGDGITFLYTPQAPSYVLAADTFKKTIESAGGSVDFLELSQQDIGSKVPGQVVSYLQAHPDTKYLVATDDTWFPGVAEAIKAAGITSPKLIGGGVADDQAVARVKNGQEYAMVAGDLVTDGWNAVDLMARLSVGEEPANREPVGVTWVITKDNVEAFPKVFPGIPDSYTKAWGLS